MADIQHRGGALAYDVIDLTPPWIEAPETILFHHGVGASIGCWAGWIPVLAGRYRLVRFDMRGHGASPVPADFIWSLDGMVEDLLAVADAAGAARFHLVGESVGGTVALACAARNGGRLQSLTVCNGAHFGGSIRNVESWQGIIERDGMAGWSAHMMEQRFFDGGLNEARAAWFEAQQAAAEPAAILDALAVLTGVDLGPELGNIETPTLILHPDSSPFIPVEVMADLHRRIAGARLRVFPHARHGLPFSHDADCAAAVRDFLAAL